MYKSFGPGALGLNLSLKEAARLASKYDFEGLQIDFDWREEHGAAEVSDILDERGLRPGSFGLPLDLLAEEEGYRSQLEGLPEKVQFAAQVGCKRCSTYIMSFSDERSFRENFEFHRRRLEEPARILGEYDISLGLEFLGPSSLRSGHRYEFIHTMEGMLELADAVDSGQLGLLLDCWHWYTSGGDMDSLKKLEREDVVDVHINDAPAGIPIEDQVDTCRRLPGETGVIDLEGFLNVLRELGYDGPVMVEPFSDRLEEMTPEEATKTVARSLEPFFA